MASTTLRGPTGERVGRGIFLVVAALGLSACSLTPEYKRPAQDLPAAYRAAQPLPSPDLPRPTSQWWRAFGSAELDALVEQALANNHDVKAASQRVLQAEAQAGAAASALLPTITLTGKRSVDAPTGGQGTILNAGTNRTHRLTSIGMAASYELDIWGKVRASEAAALATALANVHDREAVAITMVSDLVLAYLQYLEALDREAVARRTVQIMKTVYDSVRERVRLGESSELDLAQQRNVLAQVEATIPPILLARERAFNRVAILVGKPPGLLTLKDNVSLSDLRIPEVSAGLPADLLLRRPDIRKAESSLIAANANIGVARAQMLPSVSLTGERGWASQLFDTLTSPASIYYTLAANLAATIFDNGKIEANIAYSRARHAELAEAYQQAVLAGLRDVEDALAAIRYQGELEVAQREVLLSAIDAFGLSSEAFRIGMVDYLNVLDTQRTRFQAEDANVLSRSARLAAVVALFRALGGGMEADPSPGADTDKSPPAPTPVAAPAPAKP